MWSNFVYILWDSKGIFLNPEVQKAEKQSPDEIDSEASIGKFMLQPSGITAQSFGY